MDTLTQVFIRNVTGAPSIQLEKFVLIASHHTGLYIWFLNFWETGSAKFEFPYSTAAHIQTAVSSVSWDSLEVTSFRHNSTVHPASETRQISATSTHSVPFSFRWTSFWCLSAGHVGRGSHRGPLLNCRVESPRFDYSASLQSKLLLTPWLSLSLEARLLDLRTHVNITELIT